MSNEDDLRVYFDHFIKNSPYLERIERCPVGQPCYSEVIISDDELYRTEYYNDYMRSRRLGHYATGIVFERTPVVTTALSIADRKDDSARRSHQIRTLGILLPHLQRAIQLHDIVSRERTAAMATQTLFDRWTHAAFVLDVIFKLLHPVMPFLTEELWAQTADLGAPRAHDGFLMIARWPDLPLTLIDAVADAEIGLVIEAISEGRSVRQALNVPPAARPPLLVVEASDAQRAVLAASAPLLVQLLRVSELRFVDAAPEGSIPYVVAGATLALPVAEFIDLTAERARLTKEISGLASEADKLAKKLGNPDFVARAPDEVVEENRERLAEADAAKAKLEAALFRLGAVV